MAKRKRKLTGAFAQLMADVQAGKPTIPVIESKTARKYYLIVSQGTETEVAYFKYLASLLPGKMVIVDTKGHSRDTIAVVKKAIDLREERARNRTVPPYDEVWALFDKDDFTDRDYEKAIAIASNAGIESGHSNECFELWFILHFGSLDVLINRKTYFERLSTVLKTNYVKNDPGMCRKIHSTDSVKKAIAHGYKLEKLHVGKSPAQWNPYTRVYKLVDRLMAHVEQRKAKY